MDLFGIIIGILLAVIVSKLLISSINILLRDYLRDMTNFDNGLLIDKPNFYMNVPVIMIILSIIIVYIIIIISTKISFRKFNKLSPIDAIKNTSNIKATKKDLKTSTMIHNLLSIEGIIASKNIKRDKSKYKTIVLSLTISIILFLTANGITSNYFKKDIYGDLSFYLELNLFEDFSMIFNEIKTPDKLKETIEYLKTNELIENYCIYKECNEGKIKLTENTTSKEVKNIIEDGIYNTGEDGEIYVNLITVCYYGDAYNALLKKAGISELKENEIILMDTIKDKTKYGDKIRVTNYKVGDSYTGTINRKNGTFKIVGIIEDFSPYVIEYTTNSKILSPCIIQIANEKLLEERSISLALDTDKYYEIEKNIEQIANISEELPSINRKEINGRISKSTKNNNYDGNKLLYWIACTCISCKYI